MFIGDWRMIDDDVTIDIAAFRWQGTELQVKTREIKRKTYEIACDDENVPANVVNPGNLDTTVHVTTIVLIPGISYKTVYTFWKCSNRKCSRPRGNPFGLYTENWELTTEWVYIPVAHVAS